MKLPHTVVDRIHSLQAEEKYIKEITSEQVGTSIPKLFYQNNSFIVNPSQVGTGVLSRMMETDDSVSSAVRFMILMIISKIGEYHHEDEKIKKFVTDFLKRMKGPTWNEALEAMLSAKGYGFSVTEIIWGLNKNMEKVPVRLATYHPSTIAFESDEFGQITPDGVIQFTLQYAQWNNPNNRLFGIQYGWTAKNPFITPTDRILPYRMPFLNNYGMVRIPRKKCIHMTNLPMFSFGSPYGKTEVRTAHLAWGLKNFMLRQLGIAAKRNANGFIWATAPKAVQKVKMKADENSLKVEELSPTEAMIKMLSQRESDDSIVTHPEVDGYKLSAIPSTSNLDQILSAINNLDVRIFRAFLMPSLVMTDGSAGSRSLGDKHFEIVDRVSESEATKFCETLVNDLIEPAIIDNFGEQDSYGTFNQRPQSIEEQQILANIYATLTSAGIMKNHVKKDIDFMRTSLSLPKDSDTSLDLETKKDDES